MNWNWQQPNWPDFSWKTTRLEQAERQFLQGGGVLIGLTAHLSESDLNLIRIESMSSEATQTSEIEGEILDRASIQSSLQRQLGLAADGSRSTPAEAGIAELMIDLCRTFPEPLTEAMMFAWHRSITSGRTDLRDIGRYRTGDEPMQIVSGRIHAPSIHFEAPPSETVPAEMHRFNEWFNRTAPSGNAPLPALTRAGIAHLYFETIHPFEDGNGRIGRAISAKALAQSLPRPMLIAIAPTINARRKSYYDSLERANKSNEISDWLAWFAGTALEAQRNTLATANFVIEKARLIDALRGQLNARQEKALLRMFAEGPTGFKGGLSAANYISITDASASTATRDLNELLELGALTRTGELRHTRYHLSIPTASPQKITIEEDGTITES